MSKQKWDFRDVFLGLQIIRDILLGRKHTQRHRFLPKIAPRSIPTPDIPRGPVYKYSNQYYYNRNAYDSVKPPEVAPIAEGPPLKKDPFKKSEAGGVNPGAIIRDILLGRKHTQRHRFLPKVSPRSIPTPDIPRGPVYKYSNQYYFNRNAYDSVKPPAVAPIAEGPPLKKDPFKKSEAGGVNPGAICFNFAPTPGDAWWWDGHCYYELVPDPKPYCPERPPPPSPKAKKEECLCQPCPPCPLPPDKMPKPKC